MQSVFLWHQGIDCSSIPSFVKMWLLSQSCEPMPKIPVPHCSQNGYDVVFGTQHCYCDGSQVTILLCFTEIDVTLCCFLMLNCIIEQSTEHHSSAFRFARMPTNTGEAADACLLCVSPFALPIFFQDPPKFLILNCGVYITYETFLFMYFFMPVLGEHTLLDWKRHKWIVKASEYYWDTYKGFFALFLWAVFVTELLMFIK